jgi:hypothetical protein
MAIRSVARATQPHLPTLADSLRPLLALGTPASSFHLRYQDGAVIIEQGSFTGVNTASVDAAVASAPAHSAALDAKFEVDAWGPALKAAFLVVMDEVNRVRQQPTTVFAAYNATQFMNAIKARVDTL